MDLKSEIKILVESGDNEKLLEISNYFSKCLIKNHLKYPKPIYQRIGYWCELVGQKCNGMDIENLYPHVGKEIKDM